MANLVSFLRDIAKEELSAGIRETLPEMSPLFRRIVNSWENVQRNDIGRPAFNASGTPIYGSGWVFRWLWNVGGGGSFYFTNPNPDLIGGGSDNMQNVAVFAENADFPGVSDYVVGRYAVPFVGLCEGRGSLILPHQLLRANQLDSVVVDKVAQEIKNSADLLAHTEAVCYFSRSPAHGEVIRSPVFGASAPSSATSSGYLLREKLDGTADNYSLTLHNIGSEDQILRLRPGMTVDVYQIVCTNTTTSGMQTVSIKNLSAGSSGAFVVDVVDPVGKKATFVTKDGSAAVNPATSDSIGTGAYGFVAYVVLLNKTGRIASTSSVSVVPLSSADFSVMVSSTASEYSKQAILTNLLYNTAYSSGTRIGYAPDGLESWIKTQYSDTLYGISLARIPQVAIQHDVFLGNPGRICAGRIGVVDQDEVHGHLVRDLAGPHTAGKEPGIRAVGVRRLPHGVAAERPDWVLHEPVRTVEDVRRAADVERGPQRVLPEPDALVRVADWNAGPACAERGS